MDQNRKDGNDSQQREEAESERQPNELVPVNRFSMSMRTQKGCVVNRTRRLAISHASIARRLSERDPSSRAFLPKVPLGERRRCLVGGARSCRTLL